MASSDDELRRLSQVLEIPKGKEWEYTVRLLLRLMNEDPTRDGLKRTPLRVAKSLQFLTSGYRQDPAKILNRCFKVKQDEMVIVKDIDVFSLCEHHLLPFIGKCHVAYMPKDRIIGLSKIPRLIDAFARRLQVQERLTTQIAEALNEHLQPLGVACVVEAYHLCLVMRGVQKQNAKAITSSMLGVFRSSDKTRSEFLTLIRSPLG